MGESGSSETRQVTLAQLQSGVQLRVGQKSVLVVSAPFAIEVQLTAAGGTPLAGERGRIVDPDTNQQVGNPEMTDKHGVLRPRAPAQQQPHSPPLPDRTTTDP